MFEGDIELTDHDHVDTRDYGDVDGPLGNLLKRNAQRARQGLWLTKIVPYEIHADLGIKPLYCTWFIDIYIHLFEKTYTREFKRSYVIKLAKTGKEHGKAQAAQGNNWAYICIFIENIWSNQLVYYYVHNSVSMPKYLPALNKMTFYEWW